jgi:hypothetical protein
MLGPVVTRVADVEAVFRVGSTGGVLAVDVVSESSRPIATCSIK